MLANLLIFSLALLWPLKTGDLLSIDMIPSALVIWVMVRFVLPIRVISRHWKSRQYLLYNLGQIVSSPFSRTSFSAFFIADFLTSTFKLAIDFSTSLCLTANLALDLDDRVARCSRMSNVTVPLMSALPLYWRFMQCLRRYFETSQRFPNLPNACKYLIAHSVILLGVFHSSYTVGQGKEWTTFRIIWLISFLASTMFTFIWDVLVDWSMFEFDVSTCSVGLRKRRLYNKAEYYAMAVLFNFVLRFLWTASLIPSSRNPLFCILTESDAYQMVIAPLLMLLEVRCSSFRFEHGS